MQPDAVRGRPSRPVDRTAFAVTLNPVFLNVFFHLRSP